jgi:hypothetical protein
MRCCGLKTISWWEQRGALYLEDVSRGEVERCRREKLIDQWVKWQKRPSPAANQEFSDSWGVRGLAPLDSWTGMRSSSEWLHELLDVW